MNGYSLMAESCRRAINNGRMDKETAEKEIRVYEFLATCDVDDLCTMVDSTAFNSIIRAYIKLAVEYADIDKKSKEKVINQGYAIFSDKQAKEVLQNV